MIHRLVSTVTVAIASLLLASSATMIASAQGTAEVPANATRLLAVVSQVDQAVSSGDWATARGGWTDFDNMWNEVEDGFRAISRDNYRTIEDHQGQIRGLLRADAPDGDRIKSEITAIQELIQWFGPA